MPWCELGCVGFLDQYVIVEKLGTAGTHNLCRQLWRVRFVNKAMEFWDALPVTVIVPEASGIVIGHVFGKIGAGFVVIAFDATT